MDTLLTAPSFSAGDTRREWPERAERAEPVTKLSLHEASRIEADIFKWIESEKVGYDLGDTAVRRWVRDHWWNFVRARWIEHLQGRRFWVELDCGDFGLLQQRFGEYQLLIERIVDRLKDGAENLDIIRWASDWNIPIEPVFQILEALDVNAHRVLHRFHCE